MNDLDRIENALATAKLDASVFERCAQDLLSEQYPGLSPIPGGSDWGRDADISSAEDPTPARLLVTSSRSLAGVRDNMLGGIKSLKAHGVSAHRIVLANPASLRLLERQKLVAAAQRAGVRLDASDIFDRGFFASRLRRDGHWRKALLGLPSGPITLSRLAADLAESPWAFLPLVSRDEDLVALAGDDDVILTGPPGVGKSRLAGELPDSAFVDRDAPFEQIASDLRWALPECLVVDDAADQAPLLRRLLSLRQTEPDLITFRLVAICWPDDVEDLRVVLPAARLHAVDLIERAPMDKLLQLMGITGQLARGEILDQAEGRPGWAVMLADLLLRAGDVESLLKGKALLGHVDRHLRRAGISPNAMDVLAIVASLGGVSESELPLLARESEIARWVAAGILGSAAKSGLIDVQLRHDNDENRRLRFYRVRPPMLAKVLVAERAFEAPAPMVDFDGLASRWPERLGDLAGAAIDAALLGAEGARTRAEGLLNAALASDRVRHEVKVRLSISFLQLDKSAGEEILRAARASFDEIIAGGDANGWVAEPVVKVAAMAARWYQIDAAFELLLDACLIDERPTNQNPSHPLRQLDDLVHNFHPEVARREDLRYTIAAALKRWLAVAPEDPPRHGVVAAVVPTLLGLNLQSAHSDPGRPMTLQLIETVVPPGEMRRIFRELWPILAEMLDHGHPGLADALIGVAGNWLRIGGDYDHPFGQSHHPECVAAAKEIGEALVAELANRTDLSLGTRVHLRSTAEFHDVHVSVDIPPEAEVFFREIELGAEDWREAERALIADLQAKAEEWISDDPATIIARLVELRAEMERANLRWPDRTWIVCMRLAEKVIDPLAWLDAAEVAGFMPEGCRFGERALESGDLTEERAGALLTAPNSRNAMLGTMLGSSSSPTWAVQQAAEALTARDYRLIESLVIREELSDESMGLLLQGRTGSVRAMVAVALFRGRHREDGWTPGSVRGGVA
ncbi:MAG: hypothetical protein M3256_00455 [Actinomycetota bacterium]|nr:hypothetical protein [Actinomycetota bacterium]